MHCARCKFLIAARSVAYARCDDDKRAKFIAGERARCHAVNLGCGRRKRDSRARRRRTRRFSRARCFALAVYFRNYRALRTLRARATCDTTEIEVSARERPLRGSTSYSGKLPPRSFPLFRRKLFFHDRSGADGSRGGNYYLRSGKHVDQELTTRRGEFPREKEKNLPLSEEQRSGAPRQRARVDVARTCAIFQLLFALAEIKGKLRTRCCCAGSLFLARCRL